MTEGTSQGLFIVVAIVIFGIFVGLSYTIFGDTLNPALASIFNKSTNNNQDYFHKDKDYNVDGVVPNAETDFVFDGVDTITGYIGTSTEVVIPNTINDKKVTTISGEAFDKKSITKLIMPNSLTTIEDGKIITGENLSYVDESNNTNKDTNFKNPFSIMTVSAAESTKKVVGAFSNNEIEEISFSANLEYIGSFAFFSGTLDDVLLPEGLKEIGESAFENNVLKDIIIPSTVEKLGDNSFKDNSLKEVKYSKGSKLDTIGNNVYSGNEIENITLPDGIKEIPDNAYSDSGLKNVSIPEGITKIGKNAFSNNNLTEVSIPSTVTEIDTGAFRENALTSIDLPDGITSIGDYAFYKNKLPVVDLPESLLNLGTYSFYQNELVDVEIPSRLSTIKEWTFAYNKMPKKPIIPTNIKTEGAYAFYGNLFSEIKEPADYYDAEDVVITDAAGFSFNKETKTITKYSGKSKDIVIPYEIDGVFVEHIGNSAFNSDLNITRVVIPNTVKTIGSSAFEGNKYSSIKEIIIGNSVESIGARAFKNMGASHITIPDSVRTIGDNAFSNTYGAFLKTLDLGNGVETIEASAFGNNGITVLNVPSSVKTLGRNAFDNEKSTINIVFEDYNFKPTFPDYGMATKYKAVYKQPFLFDTDTRTITGYAGVADLKIPSKIYGIPVEHIGANAFKYVSGKVNINTSELVIPDTVKTIGDYAFSSNTLTNIKIGNSVEKIGSYAFTNSKVKNLDLGTSVLEIGNSAFEDTSIVDVVIPDSVKTIGERAFYRSGIIEYSSIQTIKIGNSVEVIGSSAFGTAKISTLDIPKSVKTIGSSAFYGALYLKNTTIHNSKENITLGNRAISNGTITYTGE